MVSFFKKRNSNRNSVGLNPPNNNNSEVVVSTSLPSTPPPQHHHHKEVNDYILKGSDEYIDPVHIDLIRRGSVVPLPGGLVNTNNNGNGIDSAGSAGSKSTSSSNSAGGKNQHLSGDSIGSGGDVNSFKSDHSNTAFETNQAKQHSSNNNPRNNSNSGGKNNNNNVQTTSPPSSSNKNGHGKHRDSTVYTDKEVFPFGVKRDVKGIMLMGDGKDDVIHRARTYMGQGGELYFTTEDLAQYMLPPGVDECDQLQLKEARILAMSAHGFDSSSDDDGVLDTDDGEIVNPGTASLSMWVPKSPEQLSKAKIFIGDPDDDIYNTILGKKHFKNLQQQFNNLHNYNIDINQEDHDTDVEEDYKVKRNDLVSKRSNTDKIINDLVGDDVMDVDLRTEDISRIDTINLKTIDKDQDGTDEEDEQGNDDSFSDIMNDYQFFSNGTQKGKPKPSSKDNSLIIIINNNKDKEKDKDSSDEDSDDTDESDSDSDEYDKLMSIRGGSAYNINVQLDAEENNESDDKLEEQEEVEEPEHSYNINDFNLSPRERKPSIINYFDNIYKPNLIESKKVELTQPIITQQPIITPQQPIELPISSPIIESKPIVKTVISIAKPISPNLLKQTTELKNINNNNSNNNNINKFNQLTPITPLSPISHDALSPKIPMDDGDSSLLESLTMLIDSPLTNSGQLLKPTPTPTPSTSRPQSQHISQLRKDQISLSKEDINRSIDNIFDDILSVSKDRRYTINTSSNDIQRAIEEERLKEEKRKQLQQQEIEKKKFELQKEIDKQKELRIISPRREIEKVLNPNNNNNNLKNSLNSSNHITPPSPINLSNSNNHIDSNVVIVGQLKVFESFDTISKLLDSNNQSSNEKKKIFKEKMDGADIILEESMDTDESSVDSLSDDEDIGFYENDHEIDDESNSSFSSDSESSELVHNNNNNNKNIKTSILNVYF